MKQKQSQKRVSKKSIPGEKQIQIALMTLLLVHYVYTSVLNPKLENYNIFDRDWGFDNITYFADWVKYVVYLILVVFILFYQKVGSWLDSLNNLFKHRIWSNRYIKIGLFLCLSVMSVFVFRGLTIKYDFLGDMRIRMVQTFNKEFLRNSYLTMYLLYHIYPLVNKIINVSHEVYFTWISYVSGAAYVFFALLIADLLGKTSVKKIVLFLSQVFLGSMLYFMGYKEIYAFPYLAVMIAVYINLLYANGKTGIVLPLLFTLVLPAFHILLAGMIPALVVLFVQRNKPKMPKWIRKIKTSYFLLMTFIGLIILYKVATSAGIKFELIPARNTDPNKNYMILFDYRHIWQYFNGLVLGAGTGLLVYIFMIKEVISKKLKFDNNIWFLGSVSFFLLLVLFIVNPIRGSGDWDVFALPALTISLCAFYALLYYYENIRWVNHVLWVLLLINMVNAGTWFIVNHTDKSIDKIADMLLKDPGFYYQNSQPAVQLLAIEYTENGLTDLGMKYYYMNYRLHYNDPRAQFNYALQLIKNNNSKEGIDILAKLTDSHPNYPLSYPMLIQYYNKNKIYEELYNTVDKLYNAYLKNQTAFNRIPKEQLISYFNYLIQVKQNMKDQQSVTQIKKTIATLQGN